VRHILEPQRDLSSDAYMRIILYYKLVDGMIGREKKKSSVYVKSEESKRCETTVVEIKLHYFNGSVSSF